MAQKLINQNVPVASLVFGTLVLLSLLFLGGHGVVNAETASPDAANDYCPNTNDNSMGINVRVYRSDKPPGIFSEMRSFGLYQKSVSIMNYYGQKCEYTLSDKVEVRGGCVGPHKCKAREFKNEAGEWTEIPPGQDQGVATLPKGKLDELKQQLEVELLGGNGEGVQRVSTQIKEYCDQNPDACSTPNAPQFPSEPPPAPVRDAVRGAVSGWVQSYIAEIMQPYVPQFSSVPNPAPIPESNWQTQTLSPPQGGWVLPPQNAPTTPSFDSHELVRDAINARLEELGLPVLPDTTKFVSTFPDSTNVPPSLADSRGLPSSGLPGAGVSAGFEPANIINNASEAGETPTSDAGNQTSMGRETAPAVTKLAREALVPPLADDGVNGAWTQLGEQGGAPTESVPTQMDRAALQYNIADIDARIGALQDLQNAGLCSGTQCEAAIQQLQAQKDVANSYVDRLNANAGSASESSGNSGTLPPPTGSPLNPTQVVINAASLSEHPGFDAAGRAESQNNPSANPNAPTTISGGAIGSIGGYLQKGAESIANLFKRPSTESADGTVTEQAPQTLGQQAIAIAGKVAGGIVTGIKAVAGATLKLFGF